MSKKLFHLTENEGKYNLRVKLYPRSDGEWYIAEEMCVSRNIFNPDGLEGQKSERLTGGEPTSEAEKIGRSKARAKSKLHDLIMCNDFEWFVTLTLSPEEVDDRTDYDGVIKKLNTYLANRVRRNGLKYVGVAELHKKGGLHFHFLMNDVVPVQASGTYIRPSGGKPVKEITVRRSGYSLAQCKTVYNLTDWTLGFTTAIQTYGDRVAVASYIGKYITKGEKVGGRWYYSGGELQRPRFTYGRIDFDSFAADYRFECPLGEVLMKFYKSSELTVSGK